jgi:sulfur carrier protein
MTPETAAGVTIAVNGELRRIEQRDLTSLLRALGHDAGRPGVAVAVNGEVVPRAEWASRRLEHGDRVEIVGAVQGG